MCSDVSSRNWRKQRHHSGVSVCSGCHSTLTARKTYRPMWKMPVWESFFCASTLFMCVCTLMGSNPQYPWEWDFGRRDRHLRRCGEAPGYWVESWREVAASSSALAVYGWAQGRLLKHWLIFTYLKCFFFFSFLFSKLITKFPLSFRGREQVITKSQRDLAFLDMCGLVHCYTRLPWEFPSSLWL